VVGELDIAAEAGGFYVLKLRFRTEVKDGRLDVEFTPVLDEPILAAIHVLQRSPDTTPPQTPGAFQARPGFGRNILTWNQPMEDDYAGVRILRAPAGSTTFTTLLTSRVLPALYLDHSAEAGKPYDYRLEPLDVYGNIGASTRVVSSTARDLEAPGIHNYHLTLAPEALKAINADPYLDSKVPGTFTYKGRSFPVRVRYRGVGSRGYAKKNWKVDFGSPVFEGHRQINIQSEFRDAFCCREKITYDIFRAAGVMAPQGRYVHLLLNGEELGLYTQVEQVDEYFLGRNGRDDSGSLYKANGGDLHVPASPEQYDFLYEKKTNETESNQDLIDFIDLINNTSNIDFPRVLAGKFDIDRFLSSHAVLIWLCSWDSVHINYYLVHHTDLGRWELIPWDQDTSLGSDLSLAKLLLNTWLPLDWGTRYNPRQGLHNQLYTRVLDVPIFRWKFVEKLQALSAGVCEPGALGWRINTAGFKVRAVGEADVLKWGWEDNASFHLGPSVLKQFGPLRISYIDSVLPTYKPASGPRVLINEIMAENTSTMKDEAGDFDDWFEIYNPGPMAVDVSGMYLTDKLDRPMKWKIPVGAVIAAGGRLLVWADDEPAEGKYHATFKFSADGEQVAIFDTDGTTLVDVLHYYRLGEDISYARATDGHAFFQKTALATPGTPNRIGGDMPPSLSNAGRVPNAPGPGEAATVTVLARDDVGVRSVTLFYRTGGGFMQMAMFDDGQHGDGYAGDGVFGAVLPGFSSWTRVEYYFRAEDTGGHVAMDPESAPGKTRMYRVLKRSPTTPLRIHEFLADNLYGIQDEKGDFEDWIEVYNPGTSAVDASAMFLTDDLTRPTKWAIPPNTTIPAGETLLIWADGEPYEGPLHATFALSSGGEEIGLFDRDGATLLDSVVFGGQFSNTSTGRLPSVFDVWVTFPKPTPRAVNSPKASGGYLEYRGFIPMPVRPALSGHGYPCPGCKAVFDVTRAPVSTGSLLAISINPLNGTIPGVGTVLVNPLGLFFLPFKTNLVGNARVEVAIPYNPAMSGLHLFTQVVTFEGSASLLSNGLLVLIK